MTFTARDNEQDLRKMPPCLVLIVLVAWLATGYSSQRGWAYRPTQPPKQAAGLAKTAAVVPFIDQRPLARTSP